MVKFKSNSNGITLIALIVTIIVIIIIAGISFSVLLGENGIINRAFLAAQRTEEAAKDEQERLDSIVNSMEDIKIKKISDAVKRKKKEELPKAEQFVGDFVKIEDEQLNDLGLDYTGEYYVNLNTGEVYDVEGENVRGVTYHTQEQYEQIINSNDTNKTKNIMEIQQKCIDEMNALQFNNGAYKSYSKSSSKVVPYFNCKGLFGLVNDIPSLPRIKKYIEWHFNHINSQDVAGHVGTIYDYSITDSEEKIYDPETLYDSADSYASLFFILLDLYYQKTGDADIIKSNQDKLELAVKCLDNMYTFEDSGKNLTVTKPQYKVYYLMDNCESYGGYNSLSNIYKNVFNNTQKSNFYKQRAEELKESIQEKLWNENISNPEFSSYDWAYHNESYTGLLIERTYYPYVMCQIYPILYDVVDPDTQRGQHLYYLHSYYSDSARDGSKMWYKYNNPGGYPHFGSLIVALKYNQTTFDTLQPGYPIDVKYEIEQAISTIREDFNTNSYDYRWDIAERGYLLRGLNMYLNKSYN